MVHVVDSDRVLKDLHSRVDEVMEPYRAIKEIADMAPKDAIYHEIGKY